MVLTWCIMFVERMQCNVQLSLCRVTPHDAGRYWSRFEGNMYDCILVDAPCTSERHMVQQAAKDAGKGAKSHWSMHACEDMAALQVKLLTAALKVSQTATVTCSPQQTAGPAVRECS